MKVGDLVSVIDENLRGKVLKIIANQVNIEDEHGFTYNFSKDKLTIIDSDLYENSPIIKKKETPKITSKKHNKTPLKLDLHFELLVKNPSDYEAFERLMIQREKLQETIDFCRKNKIKTLQIIHGIGDGVLQKMVYDVLEGLTNIEYDSDGFFYHQSGNVEVKFL
ncbi:dsDNA-specific endonuclease/ATPase MutS2 [Epilithonimonas hungarica]|uniref:Smr/MutS family protein n=1 Tax=Epilithonimonas hungarica TaxID=454006 RepID=UPI00277E0078|nr:Smr/MutS family protein [Epilithonimonas hungarica]MDP9956716.1 dsDNA-specific endonuclease/ATPase MutS2 [Epilithonimonas hungarica]